MKRNTILGNSRSGRAWHLWLIVFLLGAGSCPASASIRPCFYLNHNAWEATHIVMVKATANDGVFEVVESWKGDLQPGQNITIPELEPDADAVPVSLLAKSEDVSLDRSFREEELPKQIPGSRLVLFLKRGDGQELSSAGDGQDKKLAWEPSNRHMKASAAWIDGDRIYVFMQIMNPGPSRVTELLDWDTAIEDSGAGTITEAELKARVIQAVRTQQQITAAIQIEDKSSRAEHLKSYVHSEFWPARNLAFEELGKAGPPALPVLRSMLDDPAYLSDRSLVLRAYVEAGRGTLGGDLSIRLQHALAFWKATGPTLDQDWRNEMSRDTPLRNRYLELEEILKGLKDNRPLWGLNTVAELRDFWMSLPQLHHPGDLYGIVSECDELLGTNVGVESTRSLGPYRCGPTSSPASVGNRPEAMNAEGKECYGHGNSEMSAYWYHKAAVANNSDAMSNLGYLYQRGDGVARDYQKALYWYQKAAGAGNSDAMNDLGDFYEEGKIVPEDYQRARYWYLKAAAAGNSEAMNNLGHLYKDGDGIPEDYQKARYWFRKAAVAGKADAMYNLGVFYENGYGVKQDYQKALYWFQKAAGAGDPDAKKGLGYLYQQGHGVAQNYQQARYWYEKAAMVGNSEAMHNLGWLYLNGEGVTQNYFQARYWFEKAADHDDEDAMFFLGVIYEEGQGVKQDYQKAREWYKKAADAGDEDSQQRLQKLPE